MLLVVGGQREGSVGVLGGIGSFFCRFCFVESSVSLFPRKMYCCLSFVVATWVAVVSGMGAMAMEYWLLCVLS